jgi:penicillin-binding protein 1A
MFYAGIVFLLFQISMPVRAGIFGRLPGKEELRAIQNYTASEVYSSDNYLLGRYYVENRTNTYIEDIPEFFIHALIATEDARFYKHHGVDARSSVRVFVKSILFGEKSSGGGSTITQQLAKNLYPRRKLGFLTIPVAKIREIIIARRLEKVYTKSEILQLYLNTVPFGENTYGIETAALVFFNKKPSQLKMQESATLVGMLKGNTDYNPVRNYDAALSRRNLVFRQMVRYNYISSEQADSLAKLPIKLDYRKLQHDEGPAPYFREYLRQVLKEWANSNPKPDGSHYNIYTDGLKIYTTIDYQLQSYAEKAVKAHLSVLQKEFDKHWKGNEFWKKDPEIAAREIRESNRYKSLARENMTQTEIMEELKKPVDTRIFTWNGEKNVHLSPIDSVLHHFAMLQAGLLSIESKTGFVKAWVGGINYKFFKYDHVISHRQAGSTFKPVVYAAALEKGISPCSFYPNDSIVYTQYDDWTPQNADGKYGGYYSVQGALTHSINTISTQLIMETGIRNVVRLAEKMGFKGDLPEVPSLALGSGTVSLYELVQAYSVFVNHGVRVNPVIIRRIEDQQGNVIYTEGPGIESDIILSPSTADLINAMLCNVVNKGTASSLRSVYGFQSEMAGKTGTTQNHSDGWFVGITPDLITAVWVGGDNPVIRFRTLTYGQGSYLALPIFALYMQQVYNDSVYSYSRFSSFHLNESSLAALDCEDYREEEYTSIMDMLDKTQETISDFLRRIFGKNKKHHNQEENNNK